MTEEKQSRGKWKNITVNQCTQEAVHSLNRDAHRLDERQQVRQVGSRRNGLSHLVVYYWDWDWDWGQRILMPYRRNLSAVVSVEARARAEGSRFVTYVVPVSS